MAFLFGTFKDVDRYKFDARNMKSKEIRRDSCEEKLQDQD